MPVVEAVPPAPPLPPQQPRYSQSARYALGRVLGFGGRTHHSAEEHIDDASSLQALTSSNATAVHRTGLKINALSINESGTHALIAGRQIFKTIRVDGDSCAEDANIRAAIRTYNASVGDSGTNLMPKEAVDIHNVAWAKGTTGNYIAAATYNGPIILYDLNRLGIEMARLFDHRRQVHRVTFNPHAGHYMLSASQDGTVRMWDIRDCQRSVTTFTSQRATPGQADGIRDVKWSPTNGTEFALGTDGGWIQKWDTQMMRTAKVKIAGHATACSTIDWHPDGKHLLSAGADKAVRVWNVYSEGRRQKPLHEIRVPHPLRNARWRPAFHSLLHGDSGVRQCTQLVTSYDKDYPLLHIWDLRRPHLPFRELECYNTAPTDLLWHSQDLLWTVGREGVFTQSDVSYATKTIDKRNVQAFALSPHGELNVITQTRRPKPELPRPPPAERFEKPKRHQTDSSLLGGPTSRRVRSAVDDTLDDNFLSVSLKINKRKTAPTHESRSLAETPPSAIEIMGKGRTLALDSKMERFRPLRPVQMAARGLLPGPTNSMLVAYFAHKYKLRPYLYPPSVESLTNIHQVFDQNGGYAKLASMYRLSQSWRIVGQMISKDMRQRAEDNRRSRLKRGMVTVTDHDSVRDEISAMIKELTAASMTRASNPPTPLALPVHKSENLQVPSQGGSNTATPRAIPSDSYGGASRLASRLSALPDIERENLVQLPPLVIEPDASRAMSLGYQPDFDQATRFGRVDREDNQRFNWQPKIRQPLSLEVTSPRDLQTPPRLMKHDSDDSFMAFPLSSSRAPSLPDSTSSSHTQLMSMVAENLDKAESEQLPFRKAPAPIYDQNSHMEHRLSLIENGYQQDESAQFVPQVKSTTNKDRSDHSTHSPIAVPERPKSRSDMSRDMQALALNNQESFTSDTDLNPNSQKDDTGFNDGDSNKTRDAGEASKQNMGLKPLPAHINENRDPLKRHKSEYDPRFGAFLKSGEHSPAYVNKEFIAEDFLTGPNTMQSESKVDPLFTLSAMINELIKYHTYNLSDSQSLTALLLLLHPLLPPTSPLPRPVTQAVLSVHADHLAMLHFSEASISAILHSSTAQLILSGLNPLQLESILQTYHEQLLSLSLPINATLLRRLSYPVFPAVYDSALKENQLSFLCSSCRKPLSSSPSQTECDSCRARPVPCPVCNMQESPFPLGAAGPLKKASKSSKSALHRNPTLESQTQTSSSSPAEERDAHRPRPPSLYTSCLACNHAAHAACRVAWHEVDGGCPVAGCVCLCLAPVAGAAGVNTSFSSSGSSGWGSSAATGATSGGGRQRERVVEDEHRVGESRAVQGARRGLFPFQTGRMSGASAGSGGSGGSGGGVTGRSLG